MAVKFHNFHTRIVVQNVQHLLHENEKFSLTAKKNSSNQRLCYFFSNHCFHEIFAKKCEREFLQFPHCGNAYAFTAVLICFVVEFP